MKINISKIPTIAWILILPATIIGVFLVLIGSIYALANIEGLASIVIIAIFAYIMDEYIKLENELQNKEKFDQYKNLSLALVIVFFALMGMALDQPGNYIFNKPLEYFFCPGNSWLSRYTNVSNPLPGRTDVTQVFECVTSTGQIVDSISLPEIVVTRFLTYVVVAYAVIGLLKLKAKLRHSQ